MKHTFTGNLVLQIKDEKIPLTGIDYNEIATAAEDETLVVKGVGLSRIQKLKPTMIANPDVTLKDVSFCGSIFDGEELVMDLINTNTVGGCFGYGDIDEVALQSDFWKFGTGKLAGEMSNIHQKNVKTWQETQPDYSECYD